MRFYHNKETSPGRGFQLDCSYCVCLGGHLCLPSLLMISREFCEHDAVSKMRLLTLSAIQTPNLFVNSLIKQMHNCPGEKVELLLQDLFKTI